MVGTPPGAGPLILFVISYLLFFQVIRENVMVAIANIAGHTELAHQPESLVRPLLAGMLEWAVSPAAAAQDSFPNVGPHSPISPQRLAIESLCKLCVQVCSSFVI